MILIALLAVAAVILSARPVHGWLLAQFAAAEGIIRQHGPWSMGIFVLLAAISAMVAFASSSVLIPVAIYAWGPWACMALLWCGWFLGGITAYAIGRLLGRPLVSRLIRPSALARQEQWARSRRSLPAIVLLQLAVPTDLTGYVFGVIRCPFVPYALALGLAEIPYAAGAVFLGLSFVERRIWPLLGVGLAGALLSIAALRASHRHASATSQD